VGWRAGGLVDALVVQFAVLVVGRLQCRRGGTGFHLLFLIVLPPDFESFFPVFISIQLAF
jgi:hypothetical protein